MATCGYLCPACEGLGYLENGLNCHWCQNEVPEEETLDTEENKQTEYTND